MFKALSRKVCLVYPFAETFTGEIILSMNEMRTVEPIT